MFPLNVFKICQETLCMKFNTTQCSINESYDTNRSKDCQLACSGGNWEIYKLNKLKIY